MIGLSIFYDVVYIRFIVSKYCYKPTTTVIFSWGFSCIAGYNLSGRKMLAILILATIVGKCIFQYNSTTHTHRLLIYICFDKFEGVLFFFKQMYIKYILVFFLILLFILRL